VELQGNLNTLVEAGGDDSRREVELHAASVRIRISDAILRKRDHPATDRSRIYHPRAFRGRSSMPGVADDAFAYSESGTIVATYVFAWNPKLWGWPELPRDIRRIAARGHVDLEWACGRARFIEPGSRAFFVRLGVPPKGLIGSGYTLTDPRTDIHWREDKAKTGTTTNYLMLRLELLSDTPLITFDELAKPPFSRYRWAVRQSGMRMPSSIADALEPWWEERVREYRERQPRDRLKRSKRTSNRAG
jgi:hypothetical protein